MKYIALLVCCFPLLLFAQRASKLNIELFQKLESTPAQQHSATFIPVLIKGDLNYIQQVVKQADEYYKYGVKDIAALYISLATIKDLLKTSHVQRIEYRAVTGQHLSYPEDTIMLTNNNVWDAHAGGGILPHGFQGEGVLLGIIDTGFEWQHPDFLNADNTTRIRHFWDQESTDFVYYESNYGYGASWDSSEIDAQHCSHIPTTHGTHVMGTAGGNARASGKYLGIAPKADLACVNVATGNTFLSSFVDGIHFLFNKADELGKVCAINSSVGSYSSGHDAKDLYSQMIDNILVAKPGRALVQAGGNARQHDFHLGVDLATSTSKTWFQYDLSAARTHFVVYADTANFNAVDFSLELINPQTQQVEAQTTIYNVLNDFTFTGSVASISQVLFNDSNGNPVTLEVYVDQYEDAYEIYVTVLSSTNLGYWQWTTSGTGKYDIWSEEGLTNTSDIVKNITIPNYHTPDNIQSIVGYWTCSDKVITVASYQNRSNFVTWAGDTLFIGTIGYPQGGISHFSSLGPTRTGLQKPDITAPGGQVLSAAPLGTLNHYKSNGDTRLDQDGWHVSNRGTSMAAPMVAGAIALYLQCKPYANHQDIKQALLNNTRLDSFVFKETMMLPNIHWGAGKLDVYSLLESCLIYGCKDSTALNYNPLATVSDSSCVYNVTSVTGKDVDKGFLVCYPNPLSSKATFSYRIPEEQSVNDARIVVYNALGIAVFEQSINQAVGHVLWERGTVANGAYWMVLENNGKAYAHQYLLIVD